MTKKIEKKVFPKTRGQVYLATADGYRDDFMKIGFTMRHTDKRMKELDQSSGQGAKGYKILARFYVKNPQLLEAKLHRYFEHDRQDNRREWFNNMSVERFYQGVLYFAYIRDMKLLLKRLKQENFDSHILELVKKHIQEYNQDKNKRNNALYEIK
ncbi:GIY-YIG nuclease family protein [Pseudoalteromonas spongiae]|uniref:GIY-YIG nuclease family protein n=1 Tax=Pseudoalteromonas spongiae TaxID=298657 RepID=UPI000C2CF798|nr:GIY-YIG nuclease family protein [Pseudoalteromonas spongiae]